MKIFDGELRLAATDVSNHLACRHLTELELGVVRGQWSKPGPRGGHLAVIRELGEQHEARYLKSLRDKGCDVSELSEGADASETLKAMKHGTGAIVQGSLFDGRWSGRPDVLLRVEKPSRLGVWSYEAVDCKLSSETKATTILQLSFYSELLETIQGFKPEFMYVVPRGSGFVEEPYRVEDFSAYYRLVKKRLDDECQQGFVNATYPEPCAHCDVCVWSKDCEAVRRSDDHLSLVAGITKLQRKGLVELGFDTVTKLAEMPIPLREKPIHGSRKSVEIVREQARIQIEGRKAKFPKHEVLPVELGKGFCRLPVPADGDMFIDLEGDRFVGEGDLAEGREYLFGFASADGAGDLKYYKRWAFTAADEKLGFEWLVDEIVKRLKKFPDLHLYHFGHYEKVQIAKLASRYATRESEVDYFLRAELFVDLHTVCKQAVRASVEEYSLKQLEAHYVFGRRTPLKESRAAMIFIERRLELGWSGDNLPGEIQEAMEGYNADDCLSTAALREWLETKRQERSDQGESVPRPEKKEGTPKEKIKDREERTAVLVEKLCEGIPIDSADRSEKESAQWLLAQLLGWHRREERREWQEGFRLAKLDDQALLDERVGLGGLKHQGTLRVERQIPTDRYSFEPQRTNIRVGKDVYFGIDRLGEVEAIDTPAGTIDIRKTKKTAQVHPHSIYMWKAPIAATAQAESLLKVGAWVYENTLEGVGNTRAVADLLLRKAPTLVKGESISPLPGEDVTSTAVRISEALRDSVFAIQGPPGAGKTFTCARMICRLVGEGRQVGISAHSHKAIGKLLADVQIAAIESGISVPCIRKIGEDSDDAEIVDVERTDDPDVPLKRLQARSAVVAAGTAWLWARPDYAQTVDTLFIDEAGQMSLADVIAAAPAARNIVLVGDPQQLQRPTKGNHPAGAEKSALEHLIGEHDTIPTHMGMLLPQTRRMHSNICKFTSHVFYEGKLSAHPVTNPYVVEGHKWVRGAGLWFVPVLHEGNCNSSPEEVEVIEKIVKGLLKPDVKSFYGIGNSRPLRRDEDILIVAPYNAQVNDLSDRLPGVRVGTVDKFQGQEAAVVIYSLTTSSPEDAPRGMEFLYSLNRFNVATSRAMSNVIVVGSPRLFEPECRSPRQMQLANALCRYLEMATVVEAGKV